MARRFENFGRNVRWTPRAAHAPADEAAVLALLDRHAHDRIRAVGAGHAWSPLCATDGVTLDLRRLDGVALARADDGGVVATIGGGCPLHRVLAELRRQAGVTLPTIGAITEQTIAGAAATGTHGSGHASLSHHLESVRVAAFDPATGRARMHDLRTGDERRAARCALGTLGVVTAVRVRCVPEYRVLEQTEQPDSLAEVLAGEHAWPLQSFMLIPWAWRWYVWRRRPLAADEPAPGGALRRLGRRASGFAMRDVLLHAGLEAIVRPSVPPRLVRAFFREAMPKAVQPYPAWADRFDRVLTLEHELFRHVEMELFVPAARLPLAVAVTRHLACAFAGERDDGPDAERARAALHDAGLLDGLRAYAGSYTQHYPFFFRRVLPDDTLLTPTAGATAPFYTISLFHYTRPLAAYEQYAVVAARALLRLCEARPHWGKHFPLTVDEVAPLHPGLPAFRRIAASLDPAGVFRNEFTARALGLAPGGSA